MSQSTNNQSGYWVDVVTIPNQGYQLPNPWTGAAPTHAADPTPSFSLDFTSASKSGSNLLIGGSTVGTLGGTDTNTVTITSEGISTTPTSYVSLNPPTTPFGGNFSWEFVFKFAATSTLQKYNGVIGTWNGGFTSEYSRHNISLTRDDGSNKLLFWTYGSGPWGSNGSHGAQTQTDVLGGNTLMHVVLTHTSGASVTTAKKMYINGSEVLLNHVWGNDTNVYTTPRSEFVIGSTAWPQWDNGVEVVKYFRNYNSVLTQSEVTTLYNAYNISITPTPSFSLDFTSASKSGSNLLIGGSTVGTLGGTDTNTVTITSEGISTNTTSYIALNPPSANIGGDFTWELVCKLNPGGSWNGIIGTWDEGFVSTSSTYNIMVERRASTNQLQFWTYGSSTFGTAGSHVVYTTNDVLGGSTLLHMVVTHTSGASTADAKKIYINGSNTPLTVDVGNDTNVPSVSRSDFVIGRTAWTNDLGVEIVKYFRHYNSVLTQSEVTTLYNAYNISIPRTTPSFSLDFTSASKSGSNLLIGGSTVGTLGGTDTNAVTITSQGISTTPTSYISLNPPSSNIGGDFTWEIVFKLISPAVAGNWSHLIGMWNGSMFGGYDGVTQMIAIELSGIGGGNSLAFITGNNGYVDHYFRTNSAIGIYGNFVHVVVTHNNTTGTKQIFINGTLQTAVTESITTDKNVPTVTRSNFLLGRSQLDAGYDANTETVRFFNNYNVVLTQSEVTSLYNAYSTPTPTYTYDFMASGVSFSDPTLTFADNKTGTNVSDVNNTPATGGITLSSEGIQTTPNRALSVPTFSLGGSFSIEVVFRFDTTSLWNRVFGFGSSIHDSIILARYSNTNSLWFDTGNGSTARHTTITAVNNKLDALSNRFVHVVVSQDSTHSTQSHTVYIDGQSVSLTTQGGASHPHVVPTKTRVHWFGRDHFGDEGTETVKYLKYYNSVLTQSEITTLYNAYNISITPTPSFSLDFTSASKSGSNLLIGGSTVGTLGGTDTNTVTITSEGISTTSTSYVSLNPPTTPFGGNFSWEFVFKYVVPPTGQQYNGIIGTWNNGFTSESSRHNIQIERNAGSNQLLFWTRESDGAHGTHTTADVLGGNTLMHVVVTHTSGASVTTAKQIFINGVSMALTDIGGYVSTIVDTNADTTPRSEFVIGSTAWPQWDTGVEVVKYFRNYNKVLTQSEVTTLYNAYNPIPRTPSFSLDFTSASKSGSNLLIGGSTVGTLGGTDTNAVTITSQGISTTPTSYISLNPPSSNIGGDFTWEIVFKLISPTVAGLWSNLIGMWNGDMFGGASVKEIIALELSGSGGGNSLAFVTSNNGYVGHYLATNSAIGIYGNFVHVVVTHNNTTGTKQIFINGTLHTAVTETFTTDKTVPTVARTNFLLGRSQLDADYDANTETVRFFNNYNVVLTQSEITALYNAYNISITAAPTVNLPLNTILGAGPQGKNLELSFEWIDQGVTHTRFFQGFNLEESFNLAKDTGTMSAVSVQVKINEDDTPIVLTGRPYGAARWEWSFATQNYDAFEEDLHYYYSQLSLLVTSNNVPDNTAGIIFYRPNPNTTVADQSSTWTDLKLKVKLYNNAAYPGFEDDEQDWTSFNSFNLTLNPNHLLPHFSDDTPLDGKIGNTKVVIPRNVEEGDWDFWLRILWDVNHIEVGQFWNHNSESGGQFRDTNHFRGTISNLKFSLHGEFNSSGEFLQEWSENTTGDWQSSHVVTQGDFVWGDYNALEVWGTEIARATSYETNDAVKILTDPENNNNGFSVEATVNPRDLTVNSVIVARWTNFHRSTSGDFLVLQLGQRLGFKFMVRGFKDNNRDMVFVVSKNILQVGVNQRIKVRWHGENYVHGESGSNLIQFSVDGISVDHEFFDPAISALSNSILAAPSDSIIVSSYIAAPSDSIIVSSYITNNSTTPYNIDAGWDTYLTWYEQDGVSPRSSAYFLNNSGSSDPAFFSKYLTTPNYPIVEYRNYTLSDITGDIYVNPPRSPDSGVVVRLTIPHKAYYKIEGLWAWPIHSNENAVAVSVYTGPASGNSVTSHGRHEFLGYDVSDVVNSHSTFLEQYASNQSNNSIYLDELENGSYLYFVVENTDTSQTTSAAALLRFLLKRYDGTGIPSGTVDATVTATGAPLKIIPNINLILLN